MAKTKSGQGSGKGLLGMFSFGGGASSSSSSDKKKPKVAKLGEANNFYFDEKRKMWVERGNESAADEFVNPPPPPSSRVMSPSSEADLSDFEGKGSARNIDPSERYPKPAIGMKERIPSAKSLTGLRPKSRPLSPSGTFTPEANGDSSQNLYGQSSNTFSPREENGDIAGGGSLYGQSLYGDQLSDNLYSSSTVYDTGANLYAQKGSRKSKGNKHQEGLDLDQRLEDQKDVDQMHIVHENGNLYGDSSNFELGQDYPQDNKLQEESVLENGNQLEDNPENGANPLSYSLDEYNEAYMHYTSWVNNSWSEYLQQLTEAEQQQVFTDATFSEHLYNEWFQSAYLDYYSQFPMQSNILSSGQPVVEQSQQQEVSGEVLIENQDLNNTQLDSYVENGNVVLEQSPLSEEPVNFVDHMEQQETGGDSYVEEDQGNHTVYPHHVHAHSLEDSLQSQQICSSADVKQEIVFASDDGQQPSPPAVESDVQIQPYPSLESWVDVPVKKLAQKGKIQAYTPWKQDMVLTETEEEEEDDSDNGGSLDEEPLLRNGYIAHGFDLKAHDKDQAQKTPRFDLSPHPSDTPLVMHVMHDASDPQLLQETFLQEQPQKPSALTIIPPQPSTDNIQPLTPNNLISDRQFELISQVTSPASGNLPDGEKAVLQDRIQELEQALNSKQKELSVVQKSQNDLLIAFGLVYAKVDKLRQMLIDQGIDEDVIDNSLEEVEDEFDFQGEEDDEEAEEEEEEQFAHQNDSELQHQNELEQPILVGDPDLDVC
eukprot:TRINITY_DN610_c0_g1_i2.p1 TRINITY_DN610_c0_g1~~TRINITY_DN610_c0_g1_i2.p1  ORF type:complete len:768 (+),score=128.83 TRINITY_DN610_c0_g1_i2:129-2432(+)